MKIFFTLYILLSFSSFAGDKGGNGPTGKPFLPKTQLLQENKVARCLLSKAAAEEYCELAFKGWISEVDTSLYQQCCLTKKIEINEDE